MSIDSSLLLDADRIPSAATVAEAIAATGHRVEFPEGFEFSRRDDGLWRTAQLDGEATGFDYVLGRVADLEDETAELIPAGSGDSILHFGSRGDASVKLVAHVQRAICELTGAQGFVDEEIVPAAEMISGAQYTIDNWDTLSVQIGAQFADVSPATPLATPARAPGAQNLRARGILYTLLGAGLGVGLLLLMGWRP